MKKGTRFVGLDVHKDTIAVAVAEAERGVEIRSFGTIANEGDAIRRLIRKLEGPEGLHVCYEAGPCGYVLYWQLAKLGVRCAREFLIFRAIQAASRIAVVRRALVRLYSSPFVLSFPSFSLMNARISSAISSTFAHCSL
jgi:transposase